MRKVTKINETATCVKCGRTFTYVRTTQFREVCDECRLESAKEARERNRAKTKSERKRLRESLRDPGDPFVRRGEMMHCKHCGCELGIYTEAVHGPPRTVCSPCRKSLRQEYNRWRHKNNGLTQEDVRIYFKCGRGSRYEEGMAATIEDYAIGGSCQRVVLKTVTRTFTR